MTLNICTVRGSFPARFPGILPHPRPPAVGVFIPLDRRAWGLCSSRHLLWSGLGWGPGAAGAYHSHPGEMQPPKETWALVTSVCCSGEGGDPGTRHRRVRLPLSTVVAELPFPGSETLRRDRQRSRLSPLGSQAESWHPSKPCESFAISKL